MFLYDVGWGSVIIWSRREPQAAFTVASLQEPIVCGGWSNKPAFENASRIFDRVVEVLLGRIKGVVDIL